MADNQPDLVTDGEHPAAFSWSKFTVEVTEDQKSFKLVVPCKLTWTQQLVEPEIVENRQGHEEKKWILSGAIAKAGSEKLLEAIKKASDTIVKAHGVKGPYPKFLKDGAATNADGTFVKQNGRLQDWAYFTAKTKRAPAISEPGSDGAFLPVDPAEVYSGGYALLSGNVIVIGHGSDTKKGTSFWMNRVLWLGGGERLGGGGGSDESDFAKFLDGGGSDGSGAEGFL